MVIRLLGPPLKETLLIVSLDAGVLASVTDVLLKLHRLAIDKHHKKP